MKILSVTAFLIISFQTFAQKDPAAEPFLKQLAEDLAPDQAISLCFDYIREDLQTDSRMEGSGNLILFDEKYKLELDEAIIYFDGEKQYSLNTEIEEVYVSIPDPENKEFMFSDPIRLLRTYKQEFKYRLMDSPTVNGKGDAEVQLYPEELDGPYALLKLFFSENKKLKTIIIRQKDGVVYTMMLNKMEQKATPSPSYFKFNPEDYPNVDVIELLD